MAPTPAPTLAPPSPVTCVFTNVQVAGSGQAPIPIPLSITSGSWYAIGLAVDGQGNITKIGQYTTYSVSGSVYVAAGCEPGTSGMPGCPLSRYENFLYYDNAYGATDYVVNACRNYTCSQQTINPSNNYNVSNLSGTTLAINPTQFTPVNGYFGWISNILGSYIVGGNNGTLTITPIS